LTGGGRKANKGEGEKCQKILLQWDGEEKITDRNSSRKLVRKKGCVKVLKRGGVSSGNSGGWGQESKSDWEKNSSSKIGGDKTTQGQIGRGNYYLRSKGLGKGVLKVSDTAMKRSKK